MEPEVPSTFSIETFSKMQTSRPGPRTSEFQSNYT